MITSVTNTTTKASKPVLSASDTLVIEKARRLTDSDISLLKEKEFLTIEESQMLLIRMIDEEYDRT